MKTQLLTPLELKIMNILWELQQAFVKDLLEKWGESPLPAYNTISTKIRVLEDKGVIGHKTYGNTHQYYPEISREEYQNNFVKNAVEMVFNGSVNDLISTVVSNKNISEKEINEIKNLIQKYSKK